ncbi:hypothetical protein [Prosthecobacter sp.]|uniref:hypothetical protein n=1 Tax=Prosthecobacter sp. TaxID=1965333 RepID=UPI003784DFAC
MILNAFANKLKDTALQQVARWFANHYHLKKLGRVTELKVDSVAEEIFMVLELHGETAPVELKVHYHVAGPTLLQIVKVKASREWMTELVNHVIPAEQKLLEVSPMVIRALSKLMK